MHERAVMRHLVDRIVAIEEGERVPRVTRISVRLGALSHFTPEHFRNHLADAAVGTVAEAAQVDAICDGNPTDARARDVVLENVEVELPDAVEAP